MGTPRELISGHAVMQEPELSFHPEKVEERSKHPLEGLRNFGPYSLATLAQVIDPIRVAAIVPNNELTKIQDLITEFENSYKPKERPQYLVEYPGFSKVFGVKLIAASVEAFLQLPSDLDNRISQAESPHLILADHLTDAVRALNARRQSFDVLMVYLPDRWKNCFSGTEEEDFDLHDHLKARTAMMGIPIQIVRDPALSYPCRCSVMWRLGIALYSKAGGVPWKLADSEPDTAYVGLSYAIRKEVDQEGKFVTCCSQVFDSSGAGLEFIAYETDKVRLVQKNPFLSRVEMRRVMARTLSLYQRRHNGRVPRRIFVHKSTEFKKEEIEGCFEALLAVDVIDLLQVQQEVPWRGVKLDAPKQGSKQRNSPSLYPVDRGTFIPLGNREVLLWTQGNAAKAVGGRNFYKEGKSIPTPLLLTRFAGHGGWEDTCRTVLGLTKMNWNNDSLYDRLPVTMKYAGILAKTVKRMPELSPMPYEFRYFM